ncbi:hypothetical protein QQ045_006549 [Rhodiola kirilowii]
MVLNITGFSPRRFPVMYLGAPLFVGRAKIEYFEYLEEKRKPLLRVTLMRVELVHRKRKATEKILQNDLADLLTICISSYI